MSDKERTIPRFKVEPESGSEIKVDHNYLLVLTGAQAGAVFKIENREHIMGRAGDVDIPLEDGQASRKHLKFEQVGDETWVEDLGSTNGSLLNGKKLSKAQKLTEGDELSIGQTKLRFSVLNPIDGTRLGLLNHGYFESRLSEELDRSVRYKRPVSILMIKMVFKDKNLASDDSLKSNYSRLVNYVRKIIRTMDILAHYGKQDLEIILPETANQEALKLALRICQKHKLDRDLDLRVGLASYPEHGGSKDLLLEKARAALKIAQKDDTKQVAQAPQVASARSAEVNPEFVIRSPQMKEVLDLAKRVAQSTITVLILGETGVGKEVVAETIHKFSKRKDKELVCLNCAALTETLLESELFGHEKGSFTGADQTKIGLFETAQGGTIFLDEVGEMPQKTQAKLLRVLQSKKIMRVGSNTEVSTDARVIAATNRDLDEQVKQGHFREDLYYRLNAATISIPPLRERQEEISEFVSFFIAKFCKENDFPVKHMNKEALAVLERYPWPGNIRELKNTVERAVIISEDEEIGTRALSDRMNFSGVQRGSTKSPKDFDSGMGNTELGDMKEVLGRYEKQLILNALQDSNWNQTRAAEILNIPRRTLVSKIKKYDIQREAD